MSAFIVGDDTINKVVSYIYATANGPDVSVFCKHTELYRMGYDVSDVHSCAELAQKMSDMNVAAVNARYGEDEAEKFCPLDFHFRIVHANLANVIKALESWHYQCTEGDIPELDLYQAMDEVHCILCAEFVHRTEEYEAIPWG